MENLETEVIKEEIKNEMMSSEDGEADAEDQAAMAGDEIPEEAKSNVFDVSSDPFAYVNKIHTHELYKLHITNVPRYVGYQAFKKKLTNLGLSPSKIKLLNKHGKSNDAHAFVVFRSKEELDVGFKALDSLKWKSCTLDCKYAKPAADPFVKYQQQQKQKPTRSANSDSTDPQSQITQKLNALRSMSEEERQKELGKLLCETTEPWCEVDYTEQLNRKTIAVKAIVQPLLTGGAEFCEIRQSPQIDYYRNKVEFTIGYGIDDQATVGFRLGAYRFGSCYVVRPEAGMCKILPHVLCKLAASFETFIRSSAGELRPFNQVTHAGNYRFLTARINSAGQVLAILGVFTGNLPPASAVETMEKERQALRAYFDDEKRKELGLIGFLWHSLKGGSSDDDFGSNALSTLPEIVFGEPSITEELCGLKFKISPQSFFQINTRCTEVLYSMVRDFAFEPKDSQQVAPRLVLDLCCGTGTIGMVLSSFKQESEFKVVGIELCESAVKDAHENLALNGMPSSRISFICGKVEQAIYNVLAANENKDDNAPIVAVLDPPRAGVQTSVIMSIRRMAAIKRLIYVSCNPAAAFQNFDDLMREPSRRLQGDPFSLKRAVPIDLFPHTPHCELVLMFDR